MAKKKYWAGFVGGKIDTTTESCIEEEILAIYTNKKTAQRYYQDVRQVEVKEINGRA